MNTIYKLLQEDEISEITYFIKQKQLSPHTYLNGIGPTITLPLLRYMLFNNLVYVYGSYISNNLTNLSIILYPKAGSSSTALEAIFLSLDHDFIDSLCKSLLSPPISNGEKQFTKVKILLSEQQHQSLFVELKESGFIEELSLTAYADDENLHFWSRYLGEE